MSDYILPNQSEIVVPENVSGRNGYRQIQENKEQIDDEAAEELQNLSICTNTPFPAKTVPGGHYKLPKTHSLAGLM